MDRRAGVARGWHKAIEHTKCVRNLPNLARNRGLAQNDINRLLQSGVSFGCAEVHERSTGSLNGSQFGHLDCSQEYA